MSYVLSFNSRNAVPERKATKLPKYTRVSDVIPRSLGLKKPLGFTDAFVSTLYNAFNTSEYASEYDHYWGGIFNLEFSLDGKLLVAACEGKQVLLYDAGREKHIKTVDEAHLNCVNCIKFLDDNTFATGSDDALIKLWDVRNLSSSKRTLTGHGSWVKNIEWSEREQVMVTSAFDGTVYAWNLKDETEHNVLFEKVFLMSGLMRMKLTPDATKMIISTTSGFLIVVHNLNLLTLPRDLRAFRPNLYRLMQTSEQSFPIASAYNYLFDPFRKRNRIEFIDDFPNDAEVISSLQVHPHGWSVATRNLSSDEKEEWTAVHDIQERDPKDYEDAFIYVEQCDIDSDDNNGNPESRPTDLWMGSLTHDDFQNIHALNEGNAFWNFQGARQEMGIVSSGLIGLNASYEAYFEQRPSDRNRIVKNLSRMTHYVKEQNVRKGYIKGLSFSPDGRVIASPYDRGVRLLAFSEDCKEMCECIPNEDAPEELKTVVQMNNYHRDIVVSCKFSPLHYKMVTGCLGSEIKWYQPVF